MCGINGLVGFPESKRFINSMNQTIQHRGPDAQGEWFDNNVALGHRRLSIIDLSERANQPFTKDDLTIVYSGEIYNFLELKKELLNRGVEFKTNSDTEVILELFRIYRENSFNRLIGMFSFCIYNRMQKELFLVRDYFGIKPLYYALINNNKFAFSSELKALLILPEIKKIINPKALVSCINYLWIYGNESIFKDIRKIPPAHYLYLNTNSEKLDISIKKYWELEIKNIKFSEKQLKEKLKELLEKSVKRHLVADVPVGAFLSGGLDSSLISVIAKKFNPDIAVYTISFGKKEKNIEKMPQDIIYAKKIADEFDIKHTEISIEPRVIENLKDMVYYLDEPIGDPAAISIYLMCKVVKEHGIKVMLSGMGADEIFAGYRRQYATLLANRINDIPSFLKRPLKTMLDFIPVRVGNYGIRQSRWLKRFCSFLDMDIDNAYMRSYSYYNKDELNKLFNYDFADIINEMYQEHRKIFYRVEDLDNINRMCYTDINMFMAGLNLAYTDKASMAASVEVRVPFIDKEVVEFAMSVEGKYKINKGISKYILKKVATDYLPEQIVYRPKASFGMPIRAWISGDLKELVDDMLSENVIKKRGFFNYGYIRKIIKEDRKGINDNAYRIYQMLTFESWFRRFLDG